MMILIPALIMTAIILLILVSIHNNANKQISAEQYMGSTFTVKRRNAVFRGCHREVIPNYYKQPEQKK